MTSVVCYGSVSFIFLLTLNRSFHCYYQTLIASHYELENVQYIQNALGFFVIQFITCKNGKEIWFKNSEGVLLSMKFFNSSILVEQAKTQFCQLPLVA